VNKVTHISNQLLSKAACVALLFVALTAACKNEYRQHPAAQAALCLSFDDYSVDEWFALRPLFIKYNARVTFFVTRFDSLTTAQVQKLRILQHDGHEIGFHGARHVLSEHYIKQYSMDQYLQEEIIKGLRVMADSGFRTTSFAYPYSAKYWFTDHQLLNYFYVLRSSLPVQGDISKLDDAYYKFDGVRLVNALSIDRNQGLTKEEISKAMHRAKMQNEALMLFGHEPEFSFDTDFLEEILSQAQQHGLAYLRVSDLVI
jgi:peptidoglycan-N-acetylglucosamine deacetylase